MSGRTRIEFVWERIEENLDRFVVDLRAKDSGTPWRCLYAALSPEVTRNPSSRGIATTFLEGAFENADDVQVFWLTSGHLFVFFQGPVRAVIKEFEVFLDFVGEGGARPDYHFFWELGNFLGYFDQVLARVVVPDAAAATVVEAARSGEVKEERVRPLWIAPDLFRMRRARYKPLLLILEDDRVTRHMLQACMEKYCDISVAWSIAQARQVYEDMLPNLAFLDIELPDGDGQDLAELFCTGDPDAFVVMVSGTLRPERIDRCARVGVKGFVPKPVREGPLLSFINQYNQRRRQQDSGRG